MVVCDEVCDDVPLVVGEVLVEAQTVVVGDVILEDVPLVVGEVVTVEVQPLVIGEVVVVWRRQNCVS